MRKNLEGSKVSSSLGAVTNGASLIGTTVAPPIGAQMVVYGHAMTVHTLQPVATDETTKLGSRTVVTSLGPESITLRYSPRQPDISVNGKTS